MEKNTSKEGTEYELFVKSVYERLHATEGLQNVSIKHDVVLIGAKGEHQIDLYWEFKYAGVSYRVAVECKNYKNKVSIGKIRDFHDALDDIGGIKGVFATTVGFQSGAIEYAKKCGISMAVIHQPTEKDWKGRIMQVNLTIRVVSVVNKNLSVVINKDEAEKYGITSSIHKELHTEESTIKYDGLVVKINGVEAENIKADKQLGADQSKRIVTTNRKALLSTDAPNEEKLIDLLQRCPVEEQGHFDIILSFSRGFIYAEGVNYPVLSGFLIPISSMRFSYDVVFDNINTQIKADKDVLAILSDVTGNETMIIPFNGEVETI